MPDEILDVQSGGRRGDTALSDFLTNIQAELAWYSKATFTGMTIKDQEPGWLLVLRARVNGRPKVAFYGDSTLLGVYRKLYAFTVKWEHDWKDDKYSKR